MLDTDRDTYDLGLRLRELRQAKGLSQEQVARQVGVSKGTIYRYESNLQEPSLRVAKCRLNNPWLSLVAGAAPDTITVTCGNGWRPEFCSSAMPCWRTALLAVAAHDMAAASAKILVNLLLPIVLLLRVGFAPCR